MLINYDPQNRGWKVSKIALVHLARIRNNNGLRYGPHFVDDVLTELECRIHPSEEERELRQELEAMPRAQRTAFSSALRKAERNG